MWSALLILHVAAQLVCATDLYSKRTQTVERQIQTPVDTTIDLPPDVAKAIESYFDNEEETCSIPSLRRREAAPSDLAQYILCLATDSIDALAPNGALTRMWDLTTGVDKTPILPVFKEPEYQKAMGEVAAYAGVRLPTMRQGSTALVYSAAAWAMYRLAFVKVVQHQNSFLHSVINQDYLVPGKQLEECPIDKIECSNALCSGHDGICSSTSLFAHCACRDWICWEGDDIMFCDECGGDSGGGRCNGIMEQQHKYGGCECLKDDKPFITPADPDDFTSPPGDDPATDTEPKKCNGVDSSTWVSSPAAEDAVVNFCGLGIHAIGFSKDDLVNGRASAQRVFNGGTERGIHLKWTFYGNMDVTPQECENAWWEVVRGCDGNDPAHNPGNLKHGGSLNFRGGKDMGAVLEFIPLQGKDQKMCTPLTTDLWIDRDDMRTSAKAFCSFASSKDAGMSLHHEEQNRPNPIKLSVDWEEGAARDLDECNRAFETINVGCVGSNPDDYKRGGQFVIKGLGSFIALPTSNTQIRSGSGSGDNDHAKYRRADRTRDGTLIDKPALQKCLQDIQFVYQIDCFHGILMYMGNNGFWDSPSDCWTSCVNAVSQAIMDGYSSANCDAWAGGAHCWLGYTE